MVENADILTIAKEWRDTTKSLINAVTAKNYREFRRSFSRGCSYFKKVRQFIDQSESMSDCQKASLLTAAQEWMDSADLVDVWKEEVKIELQKTKKKRIETSKIKNAYSFKFSSVGLNVSRKAK
jgi:hypothetical protein